MTYKKFYRIGIHSSDNIRGRKGKKKVTPDFPAEKTHRRYCYQNKEIKIFRDKGYLALKKMN